MGVDEVYLVTDRKFGGSDTFATSYILSAAISHLGPFDIILGGKQAIDGDTGQTISSLAQHMNCACVSQVLDLHLEPREVMGETRGEKGIGVKANDTNLRATVKCRTDEGIEVLEAQLPLVCTVMKESNKPRYASIQSTIDALAHEPQRIAFEDIRIYLDETKIGLKGSPTRVHKSFVPERCAEGVYIEGDVKEKAHGLIEQLMEAKLLV